MQGERIMIEKKEIIKVEKILFIKIAQNKRMRAEASKIINRNRLGKVFVCWNWHKIYLPSFLYSILK